NASAYRAPSSRAPENTVAAAQLAWQEGADAVEGDFRITKDGHLVCMHDKTLQRTAGIDRLVTACPLEELRTYDIGSWKAERFASQRIATLEEMLATVPEGKRFFVELKDHSQSVIAALHRVINSTPLDPQQIVMICLVAKAIGRVKHFIPQCPAYWVVQAQPKYSLVEGGRQWPTLTM